MFCGFCFKFIHLCMYLQTNKHFMCVKPMCMMTHQADELVVTKADCGVGTRRQRLGPKLSWHTKPTFDTRLPSSTSVLRLSRALVRQLNSQSEWSDARLTDELRCRHVESAEKKQTRTNFSPWRGTHWENLVGQRTKTARWLTIGLVCTGLKAETSMLK